MSPFQQLCWHLLLKPDGYVNPELNVGWAGSDSGGSAFLKVMLAMTLVAVLTSRAGPAVIFPDAGEKELSSPASWYQLAGPLYGEVSFSTG